MQGTFEATGRSANFIPRPNIPFNVSIWGTFVGSVQLERSFDSGVTWLPLTAGGFQLYVWSTPASETAEEPMPGVLYSFRCTSFTSGTINYLAGQAQ